MHIWQVSARCFVAGLVLISTSVSAQKTPSSAYEQFVRKVRADLPVPKTICYSNDRNAFTNIAPPQAFLQARRNPNLRTAATATFNVTYTNFTPEAQAAFQYAVDIWANLISSPVPINIQASWTTQDRGVLGSAGPAEIRFGSDGAQKGQGIYPIALAEKIARRELNVPGQPDIRADFNRNNNWYYGLDGKTPAGQYDLVSVVLHEIAHGLGFIGYFNTSGTVGQYAAGLPSVYDHFVENGQSQNLVSSTSLFADGSSELYQQLTRNNLFLNGPILQQKTAQKIKLYAPATFDRGSSIYHVDEGTYPPGNPNSLMSPQFGSAEAIHSPGPLVMNFFADMEWKTTSVLHDALASSEETKDVAFNVRVISDTTLVPGSVKLLYRKTAPTATDNRFTEIPLPLVAGSTTAYSYTMPAATAQGDVWYYIQAQDASGRTFTNPGKSMAGAQLLHRVQFGPDRTPPTIVFSPDNSFIFAVTDSIPVYARISDDRSIAGVRSNIDTAYVDYQINGVAQPALPLRLTRRGPDGGTYDSLYHNRIVFPANVLKAGDKISYRIVARDSSNAKNQAVSPGTGFYDLTVVTPKTPIERYTNTFADAMSANDFVGYRFSIGTPTGFTSPAIQSEHPYQNGSNFKYESNAKYVLLSPITIKANPDSAKIRFDEIVLVEPGDVQSKYGDSNFFDYVVVEGSKDNGRTWQPFADGYDSNSYPDWLVAYNTNLVAGTTAGEKNSTTVGLPNLFKRRELSLVSNGNFKPGDNVLVRFRLFSDQLAHGWGWSIDNLQIQVPPPPPVLGNEPLAAGMLSVYPNPATSGLIRIEADLVKPVAEADLAISGPTGQRLRYVTLKVGGRKVNEQLDLSQLPSGLYFIQLKAGETTLTQKIVIAR